MEYLERCFKRAQDFNKRFIAVKIEMEEFPEPEVIINPVVNVENKLAYYKELTMKNLIINMRLE